MSLGLKGESSGHKVRERESPQLTHSSFRSPVGAGLGNSHPEVTPRGQIKATGTHLSSLARAPR